MSRLHAAAAGCSSATPSNDGFQPHDADLAGPVVSDFRQRRV